MSRVSLKGALDGLDLQAPAESGREATLATPATEVAGTPAPAPAATVDEEPVGKARPRLAAKAGPARRPAQPQTTPANDGGPKYLALVRKEARLRDDQVDDLSTQARRLMRNRAVSTGERITDNTLIRVAVDLLLAQSDKLEGADEDALRKSVGL